MKFSLRASNNFVKLLLILINIGLIFQTDIFAQRGIGNVKVRDESGQEREVKLYDASYALVIGASNYNNGWRRLTGVTDDVAAVKESLLKHGFEVEEFSDPTSDNFLPTVNRFVNKYGWQPRNRLLIYFAGHGYTETASDGRKFGYIVPVDAPNPQKDLLSFQQQAVTMDDIESVARKIRSRHALFVFDSCFSGTLLNARRGNVPTYISNKVEKPVRQFISSGAADQEVPDVSFFRRQFVAALNGEADLNNDKFITGSELADFLQEKVTNYTRGAQTPQYGKIFDEALDKGDFVFAVPDKNALTSAEIAWNNFRGLAKQILKYDYLSEVSEELAVVSVNEKCGFIDRSGKLAIPVKYDACTYFSEGLATVKLNKKWGYIDKTGREIIPPKYEQSRNFHNGLADVVLNGKWGKIDKSGKVIVSLKYDALLCYTEDLIGAELNGKFGFIDRNEKIVVPFKFYGASCFSEGVAAVKTSDSKLGDSDWGFIDKTGKIIISPQYDAAGRFNSGLAPVGRIVADFEDEAEYSFGLINKNNRLITDYKYNFIDNFSEGMAAVWYHGKQGFINTNGEEVIGLKYDSCECGSFSEGLAQVALDNKFGFIDKTGREVIPIKYDDVWCYAFRKEGFIGVTLNGKKGFVDFYGNEYFNF